MLEKPEILQTPWVFQHSFSPLVFSPSLCPSPSCLDFPVCGGESVTRRTPGQKAALLGHRVTALQLKDLKLNRTLKTELQTHGKEGPGPGLRPAEVLSCTRSDAVIHPHGAKGVRSAISPAKAGVAAARPFASLLPGGQDRGPLWTPSEGEEFTGSHASRIQISQNLRGGSKPLLRVSGLGEGQGAVLGNLGDPRRASLLPTHLFHLRTRVCSEPASSPAFPVYSLSHGWFYGLPGQIPFSLKNTNFYKLWISKADACKRVGQDAVMRTDGEGSGSEFRACGDSGWFCFMLDIIQR